MQTTKGAMRWLVVVMAMGLGACGSETLNGDMTSLGGADGGSDAAAAPAACTEVIAYPVDCQGSCCYRCYTANYGKLQHGCMGVTSTGAPVQCAGFQLPEPNPPTFTCPGPTNPCAPLALGASVTGRNGATVVNARCDQLCTVQGSSQTFCTLPSGDSTWCEDCAQ